MFLDLSAGFSGGSGNGTHFVEAHENLHLFVYNQSMLEKTRHFKRYILKEPGRL